MIKYFCDFCGKELKRDTPEAKGLAVGNKFGASMESMIYVRIVLIRFMR